MSSGEDRLYSALEAALKPPWALYRNVAWLAKRPGAEPADGEADVVLAHPDLGVMVIEVKGGRVQRIGGRWESIDRNGVANTIKDPFAQAANNMHRLKRVCGDLPAWPARDVRFARAIAFPDAAYDRGMTPDGPRETVIDHDDLDRIGERIGQVFDWWSASGDASAGGGAPGAIGMEALHELLAKDFVIDSPLSAEVEAAERQIRLSEQQFVTLDMLSSQRRALILGVAGSGKTLLAAEKARRLSRQGFEVLLTCFNRPLAEHLASTIGRREQGITVSTFHGLAEQFGMEAGLIGSNPVRDSAYFDSLPDMLDRALHALTAHRYDAIVVDEGQDLDSVWWLPLLDLLRDREDGIVYVFGDANQDLYHAREPDELGVVMPESPPIYHLTENRRTTRTIHDFAMRFGARDPDLPPATAVGPEGRPVEIRTYADGDPDACRRALGKLLREIIDAGGVPALDVVVLTPRSRNSSWLMDASGAPVDAWPYRLMPEYGPQGAVLPMPSRGNEVRVATVHRYKGLESPVVVLAEIDGRVDEADLAPLLYVGATRARSHLVVFASEALADRLG